MLTWLPPPQNYGEHGRELITVEVALRLLQTLADPSAELEMAEKSNAAGKPDLQATLHNTVFKVCPDRVSGDLKVPCAALPHEQSHVVAHCDLTPFKASRHGAVERCA